MVRSHRHQEMERPRLCLIDARIMPDCVDFELVNAGRVARSVFNPSEASIRLSIKPSIRQLVGDRDDVLGAIVADVPHGLANGFGMQLPVGAVDHREGCVRIVLPGIEP